MIYLWAKHRSLRIILESASRFGAISSNLNFSVLNIFPKVSDLFFQFLQYLLPKVLKKQVILSQTTSNGLLWNHLRIMKKTSQKHPTCSNHPKASNYLDSTVVLFQTIMCLNHPKISQAFLSSQCTAIWKQPHCDGKSCLRLGPGRFGLGLRFGFLIFACTACQATRVLKELGRFNVENGLSFMFNFWCSNWWRSRIIINNNNNNNKVFV